MIQVSITMTGKSYNPNEKYSIFNHELKTFDNLQDAKKWLRDTYGKSKRNRMYVDSKNEAKHIGYVIGFKNADLSHYPVEKWLQQDWIEFREVKTIALS